MTPALLAVEWSSYSLFALILSVIALLLGLRAVTKKPPPARVRPFHHFKLVNKTGKRITVASSSGHAQPNGLGSVLFGPINLGPPLLAYPLPPPLLGYDNRAFDYNDPNSGPDNVKSVRVHLMAEGDAAERDLSPIQVPPDPASAPANYKYLEKVIVNIGNLPTGDDIDDSNANYVYTLTVEATYYVSAGVLATQVSTYRIPPPPPP